MNDSDLLFIEDDITDVDDPISLHLSPWKVLIVDDDKEVHAVTKLVLSNFEWDDTPLHFLSAYSAYEAEQLFLEHDDIAVALIDVVMETDDAGLKLIETVRNEFQNKNTRIVLRTGQPGQAPERTIIREYDISDYKNKTELSGVKLDTLMCTTLRSYQNIVNLNKNKEGLELVVESSSVLFDATTYESLVDETINYLTKLLTKCTNTPAHNLSAVGFYCDLDVFLLLEARGEYSHFTSPDDIEKLPNHISLLISESMAEQKNIYNPDCFVLSMQSSSEKNVMFYVDGFSPLSKQDIALIELFASNTKISFDNEELRHEIDEGQREIVYLLGEAIEHKSKETGNHIRRVAEITRILALELGFSVAESEKIKSASPLHDLGKIGIPDHILHKPGSFTPEEWKIMQSHVEIGYELVRYSNQDILKYAALISYQHHEKWDGSGYPNGLKGEEISLVGRIASLADVFDALAHDRCYKKAWPMNEVLQFIDDQEGLHFDPLVVEAFRKHKNQIIEVNERYSDVFK
ncbi:phosphodiesterase [Psychromonas marina]|uniref:Phosphodiesterase n=1 Tax=Psychromonas marina TaxID=88364 RepID=A0ABQ6DWW8_9GAMM|nr:HD domain-containing phosphohydrolase [Psychromonas marina]GLS89644.1 phosphodiesterase [Psychromonas marina]